jgi:hypothetical protein
MNPGFWSEAGQGRGLGFIRSYRLGFNYLSPLGAEKSLKSLARRLELIGRRLGERGEEQRDLPQFLFGAGPQRLTQPEQLRAIVQPEAAPKRG